MKWLREQIGRSPKVALIVGKAVFLAGCLLILTAIFGRSGVLDFNAERAEASLPPVLTLAEVYPQYPTWLVPEGPVGYVVAALLLLVGMTLTTIATNALKRERQQRSLRW